MSAFEGKSWSNLTNNDKELNIENRLFVYVKNCSTSENKNTHPVLYSNTPRGI